MANAVPTSRTAGMFSVYNARKVISRRDTRLPRYSGVRPTMRPPRKTVIKEITISAYSPLPLPPGLISPSIMLAIRSPPPSPVNES